MTNHDHFVAETPAANLSKGMRQLNGVYTQQFNRHGLVGYLFQGRFKAILVERDTYLLELAQYVVLINPVRAGMVSDAAEWPWSSCRATLGLSATPVWLETDEVLGQFGDDRHQCQARHAEFVAEGLGQPSVWEGLRHQVFLGSDRFVERAAGASPPPERLREVPRAQRRPLAPRLAFFEHAYPDRREAMARAFRAGVYRMREIAYHFGVHYSTVSRAVRGVAEGVAPRSATRRTEGVHTE